MRPGAIVALSLTTLGFAACGGGPDARERVEDYLRDANRVQAGWADSFKQANDAYIAFSRSELDGNRAVVALDAAERDIRAAREALGRLRPPADARPLHDKLLRLFEMNIDFADQSALLAGYVPASERALAPLDGANQRLQRDLDAAEDAGAQARALERFSARLRRIRAGLGRARGAEGAACVARGPGPRARAHALVLEPAAAGADRPGRGTRGGAARAVPRAAVRFAGVAPQARAPRDRPLQPALPVAQRRLHRSAQGGGAP